MNEKIPDGLLRRYLRGTLSQTEREQFEKELDNDPELVEEVALRRAEMAASELLINTESRQWFQEWQQPGENHFWGKASVRWLLAIAAGIALIFAAILLLRPPEVVIPQKPAPRVLPPQAASPLPESGSNGYIAMARQYAEKPVLSGTRQLRAGESNVSAFRQAQDAYAAGEFQKALDLLTQTDKSQLQSATFLEAHALFQLQRFDEAAERFSRLIENNSRQFRYSSEWGLLMCRLAELPEQTPEFRQQLRDILANPQHPYYEQAKKLQTTLKE